MRGKERKRRKVQEGDITPHINARKKEIEAVTARILTPHPNRHVLYTMSGASPRSRQKSVLTTRTLRTGTFTGEFISRMGVEVGKEKQEKTSNAKKEKSKAQRRKPEESHVRDTKMQKKREEY